jgi:hypothetical protein
VLPWEERPTEVASLINPAFCSILLCDSIMDFHEKTGRGMPYPLLFLVLPLVLHKPTREVLPRTTRTPMHVWLQKKPEVRVGFSERTRHLVPYTRESLIFGIRHGIIAVIRSGDLIPGNKRLGNVTWPRTAEPTMCRTKARLVGRWFAQAGDVSTTFTMWGICP